MLLGRYSLPGGTQPFLSLKASGSQSALSIPSPYHATDDQVTEPSTVYIQAGWNGYNRWMAFVPFPGSDATLENPCIVVSNDGITWINPPGITNPVVAQPVGGTNSDPSLILSPDSSKLYMIWNTTITGGTVQTIQLSESSDGITWSAPATLFSKALATQRFTMPNMWFDGSQYVIMGQDIAKTGNPTVRIVNGGTDPYTGWPATATYVTMKHPYGGTWWHATFQIQANGHVYCLMQDGGNGGGNLYLGDSLDNGVTWNMVPFDMTGGYYRSCFNILTSTRGISAEIIYGRILGGFSMNRGLAAFTPAFS